MVSNAMEKWEKRKQMFIAVIIMIVAVFLIAILSLITLDLGDKVYKVFTWLSAISGGLTVIFSLIIIGYLLKEVKPAR